MKYLRHVTDDFKMNPKCMCPCSKYLSRKGGVASILKDGVTNAADDNERADFF